MPQTEDRDANSGTIKNIVGSYFDKSNKRPSSNSGVSTKREKVSSGS